MSRKCCDSRDLKDAIQHANSGFLDVAAAGSSACRKGPCKTSAVISSMADQHGLTTEERAALLPSGRQTTIANRVTWCLVYLNKAGLIRRITRGEYEISPEGQTYLKEPRDCISRDELLRFPGVREFQAGSSGRARSIVPPLVPHESGTPEERLENADHDLKAELRAALLDRVRHLSPSAFEQLIVDLLVRMGYGGSRREAAERLGRSGDGGIDGIIREDALGLDAVYIQAKRYAEDNNVGAPAVQGFAGASLGNGATKGVFVTTSSFSTQARDAAKSLRTHRIVLIDGEELARMMIEHEIGVRTVQTIRVQRIDLEPYEDDGVT